ncbi:uncharacterized protein LOC135206265 isoform X1 [Macrobrachium nipponense]|uniref:uncharacterized protein LOC135206265 isoform X1 n=1 Tax=Macrobrachium nipponense TaxID=159736 RepID=UPI0030C7E102
MGPHNSLVSRLKEAAPGITILKCACHSIHLCASNAVKTLPRHCEDLIRSIYTFFSHSVKRMSEFKEFQDFCHTKPHKILHASQTRWLSLHSAVSRILEQWQPLTLYFNNKHLEERLSTCKTIYDLLQDPSNRIYFQFLNFILPYFNNFNKLFEKSEPTIHLLYKKTKILYKDILRFYYSPSKLTDDKINSINPNDERNFKPLKQVFLGAKVLDILQEPQISPNKGLIADVTKRFRQFMITACIQIKERFQLDSKILKACSALSVENCTNNNLLEIMPTVSTLAAEVPRIYSGDIEQLDYEWRHLPNIEFPENLKASSSLEELFIYISKLRDENQELEFKLLPTFIFSILSLPTSNADAERIFSKLNLIKTKIRNKLSTSTITAVTLVSETVKSKGGCVSFEPTGSMLRAVSRNWENISSENEEEDE